MEGDGVPEQGKEGDRAAEEYDATATGGKGIASSRH